MAEQPQSNQTQTAILLTVVLIGGLIVVPATVSAAPSVSQTQDLSSHSDSTEQSFKFDIQLPPTQITCTLNTSQMRQRGVTLNSVTVSGTNKISMNVNQNGNVDITVNRGSGSASATVTMRASTSNVQIPNKQLNHTAQCAGTSAPTSNQSANQIIKAVATTAASQSGFTIEETGIQDTTKTRIQSKDTTLTNGTTLTQSINLDLIVPDDGDSDGDTYNVTIDTSESLTNGINVTGVSVEQDPSGSTALIEVVNSTVTSTENVTLTLREAAANRSNGNISQEIITIGLDLDATQHDAGQFTVDNNIKHVITDEAGNTTVTVSYKSNSSSTNSSSKLFTSSLPGVGGQGPPTNLDNDSKYEDVNGDGQGTFDDAIALAFVQTSGLSQAQKDALDHDGDGDADFQDAISLAFDPALI